MQTFLMPLHPIGMAGISGSPRAPPSPALVRGTTPVHHQHHLAQPFQPHLAQHSLPYSHAHQPHLHQQQQQLHAHQQRLSPFGAQQIIAVARPQAPAPPALPGQVPTQSRPPSRVQNGQVPMDPVKAALSHLLSSALALPCSATVQAYTKLVRPIARFQLALDTLTPLLENKNKSVELTQRILVSFIMYSLYAPYPIAINPFKSLLYVTFVQEREKAVAMAKEGGVYMNEQLVWVLWKILKGDGNDIGPYSPNTLARSPVPPTHRATNLTINEEMYRNIIELDDDYTFMYFQNQTRASNEQASPDIADTINGGLHPLKDRPFVDEKAERVAHGMKLLLAARERVLTLTEQRHLQAILPDLSSSKMITSLDLKPLVAHNPTLAHPLIVSIFTAKQAHATEGGSEDQDGESGAFTSTHLAPADDSFSSSPFLEVLPFLPPTLPTFDLLGRLLRDQTQTKDGWTIADLTRVEVLGRFIHESINWLERAEHEEKQGDVSDDRFAKGVQHLCRFYSQLIKMGIIDPTSDEECTEMLRFCLQYSKFEECTMLYRTLTRARS